MIQRNREAESRAQLIQTEKMAALGLLVAGVAHEINTPIGAIHSNNDIMSRVLAKIRKIVGPGRNKEIARLLDIMTEVCGNNEIATDRIMKIVRSLKNFARLDEAEQKRVHIHEGIESTLTPIQHQLKKRIRVIRQFGDIPEIECHPNQLNQVFMNVLVNAAQAIKERGEITVKTWREGRSIKISITDNGVGIPPNNLSKVFPGFTTKGVGVGTAFVIVLILCPPRKSPSCLAIVGWYVAYVSLRPSLHFIYALA